MELIPVDTYADYRSIIKGKRLINNGFLPNEIKNYIQEKRLFYFLVKNYLFFLYDEVNYYQLVCGVVDNNTICEADTFKVVKPVVCHIINNNKNSLTGVTIKFLQKNKFRLRCTIHEYVRENLDKLPVFYNDDFIAYNKINNLECQDILSLWQQNLPFYEVSYMLPADVQKLAEKNQVICLKDSHSGRIAGACYYDVFMGTTTIHHIVTDPAYRDKGCAAILLTKWMEEAKQAGAKTARSWIEDTNTASKRSFLKVGFVMSTNLSYQYIL